MKELLIETGVDVLFKLLAVLIEIIGTWVLLKIGKNENLKNLSAAFQLLDDAILTSVGDLQQTIVDGLKAASADNKLTAGEIKALNLELINKTKEKLTDSTLNMIIAGGTDLDAYILSKGENYIRALKNGEIMYKTV